MGVTVIVNVLLSIKSKYAQQILVGNKKFEFRKSFPNREIDKIYLYVSYPCQRIVGYIMSEYVFKSSIPNLKEKCQNEWDGFDVEKTDFDSYFKGKSSGVVIKIGEVFVFDEWINPYEFEGFKPPQSYYVVDDELEEFILNKIKQP